ncbi:uncharacterized protein LOC112523718 [Cynara cardunculus var. scolymus]|uniref:uncharacterized protein LOC112523718 n=1 Tax=Cynara cardunculus var. scolymus TaxID=59895 RepID=UPI000D62DA7F|nr:uncharacterized protein LOC112523718 [Cynara cardunculus var. scolymus]
MASRFRRSERIALPNLYDRENSPDNASTSVSEGRGSGRGRGRGRGRSQGRGRQTRVETERVEVNPQIQATSSKGGDIKMLLTCKPPTFSGKRDLVKAMCLLKEIESMFTSNCPEEYKIPQPEYVTRDMLAKEIGKLKETLTSIIGIPPRIETERVEISLTSSVPVINNKEGDFKMFLSCKPPTFSGERDIVKAMCWIKKIEYVFNTIRCTEADKVRFAVSVLKSNALFWWEVESLARTYILQTLSWEEFVNRFDEQFCPKVAVRQMEEDFLKLEQGIGTVQEYTKKFIEYSRFFEHYILSESRKIERYIWGLKPSIQEIVIAMNFATFSLTVDATEVTERNTSRQEEGKVTEKRKWEGPSTGYRGPNYVKYGNRPVQKFN